MVAPARFFKDYQPLFVGISRLQAGWHLVSGYPTVLLSDTHPSWLNRIRLKLLGRPARRWVDRIRPFRPAIVHAQFGWDGVQAVHLACELGVPLVAHFRGSDINRADASRGYVRRRRGLYHQASAVIAVSDFIKARLIQDGCPEDKIIVHYDGVDTGFWRPADQPIPGRICFIGRLIELKGCQHLIKAVEILRPRLSGIELVVIGDGPMRPRLERMAAGLPIRFLGMLKPQQVMEELARCWLCCIPSVMLADGSCEGLGNVSLEAQSCGVPVIVGDTGGLPESVIDGETGMVVNPTNHQQLAEKMLSLLLDPAMRSRMGKAARSHVLKRFDLSTQTAYLELVYTNIITRSKTPTTPAQDVFDYSVRVT